MLPVAAAAAAGSGVRAGPLDPLWRRRQHLDGVGPQEVGGLAGDPGADPLPRQGVPDEDDPAVGRPADARATGGDAAQLEVEQLGPDGSWTQFGVQATLRGDTYATYIFTNQIGDNTYRMTDPATGLSSDEVTVSVG